MRHVAAVLALLVAAPAFAAQPASADKPKMRKICKQLNNGNPLFPQISCRTVPVETASAPVAPATPAAPEVPAGAPQPGEQPDANGAQPH